MASANAESGIATQITAPRDLVRSHWQGTAVISRSLIEPLSQDSSITAALAQVIERYVCLPQTHMLPQHTDIAEFPV